MLENFNTKNSFEYQKLTEEEQNKRGILGRLVGPIADSVNPTRNGRRYSAELWEKVFKNPIMQEKIENRVCFGELGHPVDRTETDMEKICWCLAEVPKKGDDGQLYGVFDILPTPNGRILKALCDYGSNIGTSSRGSGDTFLDYDGQESVDPDTYECECWDAVLLPAVKTARLTPVTESLHKTLQESLHSLVENANEADKKVMTETLNNLNLDYNTESVDDNIAKEGEDVAADNNGAVVESLQVAVKQKQELESKVLDLQEKLSVSYAKETRLEEQIAKYSKAISNLSNTAKKVSALQQKINSLTEELNQEKEHSQQLAGKISKIENVSKKERGLKESLKKTVSTKDVEINSLNEAIEQITNSKNSMRNDNIKLMEQISTLKKDAQLKKTEYLNKLEQSNKLVEKYKKVANKAVERYIESQADKIGVSAKEIQNKLPESYTFQDIDSICEDLQSYKLTLTKLPFSTSKNLNENVKINVKSSTNESIIPGENFNVDDEIDEMLKSLI